MKKFGVFSQRFIKLKIESANLFFFKKYDELDIILFPLFRSLYPQLGITHCSVLFCEWLQHSSRLNGSLSDKSVCATRPRIFNYNIKSGAFSLTSTKAVAYAELG